MRRVRGLRGSGAAELTYYGLHALQHRGQEGCGIVSVNDAGALRRIKGEGLVTEVFNEANLRTLEGSMAVGHVRYSTSGGGGIENVQPFLFRHFTGDFALAHNGNLVNSHLLRRWLEDKGSLFQSSSDSEVLAHLIKKETRNHTQPRIYAIVEALNMIEGAFAFLIMTANRIYAARDKYGLRPLSIGRLGDGFVVSSETCALDAVGAEFLRDVEPGEIATLDGKGIRSTDYSMYKRHAICAMEYIYFARPDSDIERCNVHAFRKRSGRLLWQESPADADVVVGVPDSSLSAAMGFAEASRHPLRNGAYQEPLHRPHLHSALAGDARKGGEDEALGRRKSGAGQARGAGGRLDRAGHHLAAHRAAAARSRSHGGACAYRQPSDHAPLLLRGRYLDLRRAAVRPQEPGGGVPSGRGRLAALPLARGAVEGGRARRALYGLFHGALPDGPLQPRRGGQQGREVLIGRSERSGGTNGTARIGPAEQVGQTGRTTRQAKRIE